MTTMAIHASSTTAGRAGWRAWVIFSPLALWLALFVAAPTVILLAYSVFSGEGIGEVSHHLTARNFARIFTGTYLHLFARSIGYAGATTILCALIGYPVASFIGRSP